jgi:hypothetical protein
VRKTLTVVLLVALVLPGCFMRKYRQQAVEISRREVTEARGEVAEATKAVVEIAQALTDPAPDVSAAVARAATALQGAHGHVELAGRVLSVMQADVGRTEDPAPEGKAAVLAWCVQYRMAAAAMQAAMSALGSRVPFLKPKPSPPVKGWSPTSIVGLVTAALAAVGAAGEGARRGVKRSKRKRETHDAELAEALSALDEIKGRHPKAVKEACARDKRPHLRAAFVRREGV